MAIQLTNLLQHANTVGAGGHGDQQIHIREDGSISERSGLGFFKRMFSSSAKTQENQASLQAFRQAIANDPTYAAQLESEQVATFFRDKQAAGTPLTAKDVQTVQQMLDLNHAQDVGHELAGTQLGELDATGFAWFCVGKGLTLNSPDEIKDALKSFFAEQDSDRQGMAALREAGVPDKFIAATLATLKASSAWSAALDHAFAGDLGDLTKEGMEAAFREGLGEAINVIDKLIVDVHAFPSFFTDMVKGREPSGISLFNGTMEAVRSGAITDAEAGRFLKSCKAEQCDLRTPQLLTDAIGKFCIKEDSEIIFTKLAEDNGFPAQVGKSLAHNPEFIARAQQALTESFPPPAIPSREDIQETIDQTAAVFLVDKNETIREFLAMAGKTDVDSPILGKLDKPLTEQSIGEMLNALLSGQALLETMLEPDAAPDLDMLTKIVDHLDSIYSCRFAVEGEFGASEAATFFTNSLSVVLAMRGDDAEGLESLGEFVRDKLVIVGTGLKTLTAGLLGNDIKAVDVGTAADAATHAQGAVRELGKAVYQMLDDEQKAELGFDSDPEKFIMGMEFGPGNTVLPERTMHQSVRDFALTLGVKIGSVGYMETHALAEAEADAFTGNGSNPEVTELLRTRSAVIAGELGIEGLDTRTLDPATLGSDIERAVRGKDAQRLTPAQAREVSEQVIREHLQALKPTLEFIRDLPTVADPEQPGQFVVSPQEKQLLMQIIPNTPLRDPALIKAMVTEARAVRTPLDHLKTPGMEAKDIAPLVMKISATNMKLIGGFKAEGKVADEVYGAYGAALRLALGTLDLTPAEKLNIFEAVSGEEGIAVGRGLTAVADLCEERRAVLADRGVKKNTVLGAVSAMNNLRMILGPEVGAVAEDDPFYYGQQRMGITAVPPYILTAVDSNGGPSFADMPAVHALGLVSPKLSRGEWNQLVPLMEGITTGFSDPYEMKCAVKMVAANSRELLAAIEANGGRPLSPAQIWQTVIGGKAPSSVNAGNLGPAMLRKATEMLMPRVLAVVPELPFGCESMVQYCLGRGLPFQTLYNAYQPGGRVSLEDIRQAGIYELSALLNYDPENAYGLVTDFARRGRDRDGTASLMTIESPDGSGFAVAHRPIPETENKPDNPIFGKIMGSCRALCRSDLQFRRVMQSLSQASTANLRMLSEVFFGTGTSEHGYFNSTVKSLPSGDVVVELTNGEDTRPFGAHIKMVITPEGKSSITEMDLEFRG